MSDYAETVLASAISLKGWNSLSFFRDGGLQSVTDRLAKEKDEILPPARSVFAALDRLPPDSVRVVIIGQDPYPTPGHAHGLAFSVADSVTPLPRSLKNIFGEMEDDIGVRPSSGNLTGWVDQGVLLLNVALTLRAGEAASHAKIGWAALTDQIIAELASKDGLVWVLWGNHAKAFRPWIEAGVGRNRLIIESAHPSPLSARRGFFGSKPFSRINAHLAKRGEPPIQWAA